MVSGYQTYGSITTLSFLFQLQSQQQSILSHPPLLQLAPVEPGLHRLPRQQPHPQHRVGAALDRWDQHRPMAPGPGEGEGDHGQRVLVLQVVEHGETDVLFLGQPHPVLQPLDRSLVLTSPLSLSFLLPLTPHPFHSPLPLILAPHTSGHPLISSHPGI